ncbi:MAG: hypothetical protein Q4F18_11735 [Clostridia bacterium]|nr:hypothetical protein [Clostridia bacterium]
MIEFKVERDANDGKHITMSADGQTNDLLDELAIGTASCLVELIDDLNAQDDLYETAARSVTADIELYVRQILAGREQAQDAKE